MTGKCGSVLVRLIPAPRGTGIVAAGVPKKLLNMAGVSDCYTSARGQTATLGNFGEFFFFLLTLKLLLYKEEFGILSNRYGVVNSYILIQLRPHLPPSAGRTPT